MIPLALDCPRDAWPQSFDSTLVIGIKGVPPIVQNTLWLSIDISNGSANSMHGVVTSDKDIPAELLAQNPSIIAAGQMNVWKLVSSNPAAFYKALAGNQIHLSGDFRSFGRVTPTLIRVAEATTIWMNAGQIAEYVISQQVAKAQA